MGDVTLGFYIHNSVRRMTMKLLAIKGLLLSFHSSSRSCGSSHINNVILSCIAIPKAISNYLNTTILYKILVSSTSLCSTSPVKLTFALQILRQSLGPRRSQDAVTEVGNSFQLHCWPCTGYSISNSYSNNWLRL